MQLSHTPHAVSVSFDDPNLVSAAGLVPTMRLAQAAGLQDLGDAHLSVPTDKGANAGAKVTSLVAGMVAGADSIDDMALLRHGGMKKLFSSIYAPSTLGSFLRKFTFGHVRQLDAVASRFLAALTGLTWLLGNPQQASRTPGVALLDVDDTIIEVHGHAKQGATFGYPRVRGYHPLLATRADTGEELHARMRKGSANTQRGTVRFLDELIARVLRAGATGPLTVRVDSGFWSNDTIAELNRLNVRYTMAVRCGT